MGGKAEVVQVTLQRGDGKDEQQVAVKKLRTHDDMNKRKFCNVRTAVLVTCREALTEALSRNSSMRWT